MDDLINFLRGRLDDRAEWIEKQILDTLEDLALSDNPTTREELITYEPRWSWSIAETAAMRAIVEASVRILDGYEPPTAYRLADDVLQRLAVAYAAHPDYRPEWRPQ